MSGPEVVLNYPMRRAPPLNGSISTCQRLVQQAWRAPSACPGGAGIEAKSGPKSPIPEKGLITIASAAENPQDGGARWAETNLISAPFGPRNRAIIRHPTLEIHGNPVKLKACPERGSYKSQANDLHRSCPKAHRPKHARLFSRRQERQRNRPGRTPECEETKAARAAPAQGIRR